MTKIEVLCVYFSRGLPIKQLLDKLLFDLAKKVEKHGERSRKNPRYCSMEQDFCRLCLKSPGPWESWDEIQTHVGTHAQIIRNLLSYLNVNAAHVCM